MRADLRTGILAATDANIHRTGAKTYKPADFMPDFRKAHEEKKAQTVDEMKVIAQALTKLFGGEILGNDSENRR